jgi:hypothetical protein
VCSYVDSSFDYDFLVTIVFSLWQMLASELDSKTAAMSDIVSVSFLFYFFIFISTFDLLLHTKCSSHTKLFILFLLM